MAKRKILTVVEVSEFLRLHSTTVYRLPRGRENCQPSKSMMGGASTCETSIDGASQEVRPILPRGLFLRP